MRLRLPWARERAAEDPLTGEVAYLHEVCDGVTRHPADALWLRRFNVGGPLHGTIYCVRCRSHHPAEDFRWLNGRPVTGRAAP